MSIKLNNLASLFESEMQAQQSLLWKYALAQSCLESRYFRSALVTQTNNAWGIKYRGQAGAEAMAYMTTEYRPDKTWYKVSQEFCKWHSVGGAVAAYYRLVERRYPKAWASRNAESFFDGLHGWATDPRYPELCMSVYMRIFAP